MGKWAARDGHNSIEAESLTNGPISSELIQNRPAYPLNGYDPAQIKETDVATQN
jgi:hypothetical protein